MLSYINDRDDCPVVGSEASECLNSSHSYILSHSYSCLETGPGHTKAMSQQDGCHTSVSEYTISQSLYWPFYQRLWELCSDAMGLASVERAKRSFWASRTFLKVFQVQRNLLVQQVCIIPNFLVPLAAIYSLTIFLVFLTSGYHSVDINWFQLFSFWARNLFVLSCYI